MRRRISFTVILLAGQSAFAQVAIQQPVVGTTAVNTTVSVPDRGTTYLGGTSSALSARSQSGPLRSGTALGISRQSSSMSVSARVIDLHAMDQEILNSRPSANDRWNHISNSASSFRSKERSPEPEPADTVSPVAKAARSEALALEAENARKMGVARLHWKMAAKYGSKYAEKRLAEWDSK